MDDDGLGLAGPDRGRRVASGGRARRAGPCCKPRSRLSASQWQSAGREYTSNIRRSIRNAARRMVY
eukprot:1181018-Prorocentrum_minimum.AAC.5